MHKPDRGTIIPINGTLIPPYAQSSKKIKVSYGCTTAQANGYTCIHSFPYCKLTEDIMHQCPFGSCSTENLGDKRREKKDEALCYTMLQSKSEISVKPNPYQPIMVESTHKKEDTATIVSNTIARV
jgi:hypothetical protein